MIKDFARHFIRQAKLKEIIDMRYIKQRVDSGDLLKAFTDWRQKMWKERIELEGKHSLKDLEVLRNPEVYGYRYRNLEKVRAEKRPDL